MAEKTQAAGMSKMEAVRQAISKLGADAGRTQIQSFVKEKFGIEMSADHISNYKGEILKKAVGGAKPATKKPVAPTRAASSAAAAKPAGSTSNAKAAGGIGLQDIQAVKELVGRVGPEHLKGLVDILAK
jgi:hypothetical protein